MRKIKRHSDIKAEKNRLRLRELELEKQIRQNWSALRNSFSGSKGKRTEEEPEGGDGKQGFWGNAIDLGISFLGAQVAAKAGETAEQKVKESLDRVRGRLKSFLGRRKRRS